MEEGSLRCDANVSVRPQGEDRLGVKVEIKNLNSFRFLQKALDYEIERQIKMVAQGEKIIQETRLWDEGRGCTFAMRSKEEAHDYRYFPEPDLPPVKLDPAWIQAIEQAMPELPHAKTLRFIEQYNCSTDEALNLTASVALADYFEACAESAENAKAAANWIMGDLAYALKNSGHEMENCPLPPLRLAALIRLVDSGKISGKIAKTVFEEMYRGGEEPAAIVERLGLVQVSDEASLLALVDKVIAASPKQVEEYRGGKDKVLGCFVGQVMKETKGQANPKVLNELLVKRLKGE